MDLLKLYEDPGGEARSGWVDLGLVGLVGRIGLVGRVGLVGSGRGVVWLAIAQIRSLTDMTYQPYQPHQTYPTYQPCGIVSKPMRVPRLLTTGAVDLSAGRSCGSCAYWWWYSHFSEGAIGTE